MDYSCARAPFLETLDDDACVYVVWTALSILTRRTQGSQLPHTETALNTAKQAIQDGMQKFLWMYLLFKSLVQLKRNAIYYCQAPLPHLIDSFNHCDMTDNVLVNDDARPWEPRSVGSIWIGLAPRDRCVC